MFDCQEARGGKISELMTSSQNELSKSQEELLQSVGCQCSSPSLNLTTTDQNILKKSEAVQLGQYQFQVKNDLKILLPQNNPQVDLDVFVIVRMFEVHI